MWRVSKQLRRFALCRYRKSKTYMSFLYIVDIAYLEWWLMKDMDVSYEGLETIWSFIQTVWYSDSYNNYEGMKDIFLFFVWWWRGRPHLKLYFLQNNVSNRFQLYILSALLSITFWMIWWWDSVRHRMISRTCSDFRSTKTQVIKVKNLHC